MTLTAKDIISKKIIILDGAAALDNRPTQKWPIHFILGDAPTLNPMDTTKVQVTTMSLSIAIIVPMGN